MAATKKKKKKPVAKKKRPAPKKKKTAPKKSARSSAVTNAAVRAREMLAPMVGSTYYPQNLVQKGQHLLLALAARLEQEKPRADGVYALTHATTEAFNDLQEEFWQAGSELETVAREAIADDIGFLLKTYGYDVEIEEAIAPRDW